MTATAYTNKSIWVVVQQGRSSSEHYIHTFDRKRSAEKYIAETALTYECLGPFEILKTPLEAAAPELLAALSGMMIRFEATREAWMHDPAMIAARAAIDKAKQ